MTGEMETEVAFSKKLKRKIAVGGAGVDVP